MSRHLAEIEAFLRWRDVVEGDLKRRRLGEGVEHVLDEVDWKMFWCVVNLVGDPACFSAENGDARFGDASRRVGREIKVQEFVVKRPIIWDSGGRCKAHGEDLKGPIQLKDSLVLRTMVPMPFLAPWRMVVAEL